MHFYDIITTENVGAGIPLSGQSGYKWSQARGVISGHDRSHDKCFGVLEFSRLSVKFFLCDFDFSCTFLNFFFHFPTEFDFKNLECPVNEYSYFWLWATRDFG